MHPHPEDDDDMGPDDSLEIEPGRVLGPSPDAQLALTVPLTDDQVDALTVIARARGIDIIATVQALVGEGLERRVEARERQVAPAQP